MDLIDREEAYKVLTEYYHHRLEIQHKGLREALAKVPTIEAYTIEDLRNAYRDGEDNECSYHWGIRKAEPWYMKDKVEE